MVKKPLRVTAIYSVGGTQYTCNISELEYVDALVSGMGTNHVWFVLTDVEVFEDPQEIDREGFRNGDDTECWRG